MILAMPSARVTPHRLPKPRPVTMWAGYSDGKLDLVSIDDAFGKIGNYRRSPALFVTRYEAEQQYEDVRKVRIVPISKPRRGRRG